MLLPYDLSKEKFHNWGNPKYKSAYAEPMYESLQSTDYFNQNSEITGESPSA